MSDIQIKVKQAADAINGGVCYNCGWEDLEMRFLPHQPSDPPENWIMYRCPNCSKNGQVTPNNSTPATSPKVVIPSIKKTVLNTKKF